MSKNVAAVDIRSVADFDRDVFVTGCHYCTDSVEVSLQNTKAIVESVSTFIIMHLQTCGKEIN